MQPIREVRVVLRWTMAVLMLGAAAVHFAVMGEHAGVSWTHGLFFAVTAWAQVVLACWLVLRPSRTAVVTTVLRSLIYEGISDTSRIVGLMYLSLNGQIPEGFAGPNDHWHRHQNVCVKYGAAQIEIPFPADSDVTSAMCSSVGGRLLVLTTWMVHAWVVPGWESPQGVFSHANPNVPCADGTLHTDAVGFCQGT